MKLNLALYGADRLGRAVFNIATKRSDMDVVVIATDYTPGKLIKLLDDDPIYTPIKHTLVATPRSIIVEDREIPLIKLDDRKAWEKYDIDVVVDTVAVKASNAMARKHQAAGGARTVFAASGATETTVVLGVNEEDIDGAALSLSAGGPLASAVLPVLDAIRKTVSVEHIMEFAVDGALCFCEGKTAGRTCEQCAGESLRHESVLPSPLLTASLGVVVFTVTKPTLAEEINAALKKAAGLAYYQGIFAITEKKVQADSVIGESVSALVETRETKVIGGKLVSLRIWYDREWAYANRLIEIVADYGKAAKKQSEKEIKQPR